MIQKMREFGRGVVVEMNRVSWPSWPELRGSTFVVLGLSLVLSILLFAMDFVINRMISIIL